MAKPKKTGKKAAATLGETLLATGQYTATRLDGKPTNKLKAEPKRASTPERRLQIAEERADKLAVHTDPNAPLQIGFQSQDGWAGRDGHRELFRVKLRDGTMSDQWLAVPHDKRRCTAKVRKGPYAGYRCRGKRLRGADVCTTHGGALPAVKKAAQMRLLAASDLVAKQLVDIALSRKEETPDRIRAANSVLDRAGVDAKQTMTVEVKPWQKSLVDLEAKIISKKAKKKAKAKAGKVIDGKARED